MKVNKYGIVKVEKVQDYGSGILGLAGAFIGVATGLIIGTKILAEVQDLKTKWI